MGRDELKTFEQRYTSAGEAVRLLARLRCRGKSSPSFRFRLSVLAYARPYPDTELLVKSNAFRILDLIPHAC